MLCIFKVHLTHDAVPVKVGKVGRGDTDKRAAETAVQAGNAFVGDDLVDGIERRCVVLIVGCDRHASSLATADLDLQSGFDAVR